MGFARYKIEGCEPELPGLERKEREQFNALGFRPFAEESDFRDKTTGWVDFWNAEDYAAPGDGLYELEHLALVAIREDARRIPPALFKREYKAAEAAMLSRMGRERLSRVERNELKETIHNRLIVKALPTTRALEVLIDRDRGEAIIFSPAQSAQDLIEKLFEKTFGRKLTRIDGVVQKNGTTYLTLAEGFLTWLWENAIAQPDYAIGSSIDLTTTAGAVIHARKDGDCAEAKSAMEAGAIPSAIGFELYFGEDTIPFVLTDTMLVKGLKLPQFDSDDPDESEDMKREASVLLAYGGLRRVLNWLDAKWAKCLRESGML